jgi:N-acetyl-gamma-glutamyl-phosphate reductase
LNEVINVGVVGGTGYTGAELLRLLIMHPEASVSLVTSRVETGKRIDELYSNLRGHIDLSFAEPHTSKLSECDVVFFSTPNGTAMKLVPEILEAGAKVIDLAADFRLKNATVWEQWYGISHACPSLLPEAVYGLPEINRDAIRRACLVANPGCYPTAVLLGLMPLVEQNLVDTRHLIADAKSGVSGAGRKAQTGTLLCEVSESLKAYGVAGHRHLPEIQQMLAQLTEQEIGLTFVPHLIPMIRGIHATLYATSHDHTVDLQKVFNERYGSEPFVDVQPKGAHPETRGVRGTNVCRIAVHQPESSNQVVVLSVIDNLVKGAAGQAIQNMNLMFDYDEALGLEGIALMP